jgi:hypothetical protein
VERIVVDAFSEATALGHTWVGAEHLLLALAKQPPDSSVRQALDDFVLDESYVASYLAETPTFVSDREGASPNPRFYGIVGRAEGMAVGMGTRRPLPEHFFLALIWEPCGPQVGLLTSAGATASGLQAALAARNVLVPQSEPPPFDDRRWGDRVPITRAEYNDGLPGRVARLLPPGTGFGCNATDEGAWIQAEEGFDLLPYLEQARATPDPR